VKIVAGVVRLNE